MRVTEKAALLTEGLKKPSKNEAGISPFYISELLAGRSVALSNLFGDDRFKDAKKITLQNDLDANYNELCEVLDDHISVVTAAKDVYDAARFAEIIGTHRYLCDAKIDAAASGVLSGAASTCTDDAGCSCADCRPSQKRVSAIGSGAVMAAASISAAVRAKMHSAANRAAASRNGTICPCARAGSSALLRIK